MILVEFSNLTFDPADDIERVSNVKSIPLAWRRSHLERKMPKLLFATPSPYSAKVRMAAA